MIERNVVDPFDPKKRVINFWVRISNGKKFIGVFGIAFDSQKLVRIFNSKALKPPYAANFVAIY